MVLVNAFAPAHGVIVKDVDVKVEGDLDPDGFMGTARVRPGFSAIRYKLKVESDSDPAAVAALIEHAENSCREKTRSRECRSAGCNGPAEASGRDRAARKQ